MRRIAGLTAVMLAILCGTPWTQALEKHAVRVDDLFSDDEWNTGSTCAVRYFNVCTGWVWCWGSDFSNGEKLGVVFDTCCKAGHSAVLSKTIVRVCTALPAGYGYTGFIAIHEANKNGCPVEPPIMSKPFLPSYPFENVIDWGGLAVPSEIVLLVTTAAPPAYGYYGVFASDHPAAGPSGPPACGTCFSSARPTRSFTFAKSDGSPTCTRIPFNDGVCNAELLWEAEFSCAISVEESTWGAIKSLYR